MVNKMSPLTPSFANSTPDQSMLKALPEKLRKPYSFLLEKSLRSPETAAFATYLFSAALGNADAWRRVLEVSIAAHALRDRLRTQEQVAITNCMIAAANILADLKIREVEAPLKPEAAGPKSEKKSQPVKQAERKPKPASHDMRIKPGTLAAERK